MRVAILGCGYVGTELAGQLVEEGHDAVGIRRSESGVDELVEAGIDAVAADVTDPSTLDAVPDADALVFAASTGGRGAAAARRVYAEGLRSVLDHFGARTDRPSRLVFTSSTGVYGDHDGERVDETTTIEPTTEKTRVLGEAERIARETAAERGIDGTVVRYAGIYGPGRYRLDRYLDGPVTAGCLNMLHRDDAAGVVRFLLEEDRREDLVLAVDDEPVSKWEFADWLADRCGVERPPKRTVEERLDAGNLSDAARRRLRTSKRCSNERLRGLGYQFAYPTYRDGYRAPVERRSARNRG